MNPYPSRRRDRAAFTLMEVLLVLVILVVLGSLAVGVFRGTRQKADRNAAKAQIGLLESQLGIYELDIGQMPPSLNALLVAPNDAYSAEKWGGPYIDKDPIDPWGSPYQYQYPGSRHGNDKPDIWSMGPDQSSGTDDDVYNE